MLMPAASCVNSLQNAGESTFRTGAELVAASKFFQKENRLTSWRLLVETLVVHGLGLWLVFHLQFWPLQIIAGMLVIGCLATLPKY